MLFYEVVGASTRKFSISGEDKTTYNVIAELVDKQTHKKVYVEELLNSFGANVPNTETYLLPTTFQTTDNSSDIVRLDDFYVVRKSAFGGLRADYNTFTHESLTVVCDKKIAIREGWAK